MGRLGGCKESIYDGRVSSHNYTIFQWLLHKIKINLHCISVHCWYTVHCCSTLEERAHRLFMTKGVVLESLDPSQFAKSRNPHKRDTERQVEVGLLEAQVYRYAELLGVSGDV